MFLILLLINIILHNWIELILVGFVFNILRIVTDGVHAQSLRFCFIFSTIYFTILAILTKCIIDNTSFITQIIFSFIIILWSIHNYKNIPKNNINNKNIKNQNANQELTTKEKKKYYKILLFFITAAIYSSNIFFNLSIVSVSLTIGLLSVNIILNSYFEKIFVFIEQK